MLFPSNFGILVLLSQGGGGRSPNSLEWTGKSTGGGGSAVSSDAIFNQDQFIGAVDLFRNLCVHFYCSERRL